MTSLFPHNKEEKRQLTAVWLYFLFGGNSALFNISAIINGSASIELLCFNPLTKNIAKRRPVSSVQINRPQQPTHVTRWTTIKNP